MIYEAWIEFLESLLGTLKFFKDHPTVPGILFLMLRQNNIRKVINRKLPRQLRDNMESDIRHIQDDIKRIMDFWRIPGWDVDAKYLKKHTKKHLWIWLRTAISPVRFTTSSTHRKVTKKSIWRLNMKHLKSQKLWLALLGAVIPVINVEFGLNLDSTTIIVMISSIIAGIAGIAHVDAKQVKATVTAVKVAVTADPNLTYKDMVKTVNTVHTAITEVLADLQKNDGSAAFHAAADAYTTLLNVVHDFKKPEPLPAIEQKVTA